VVEVEYRDFANGLSEADLQGFFVGWPEAPSPAIHLRLLQESDHVFIAIESESGRVVGFITAISDGVLMAYVPLLEVLPEYQRRGIGSELVRRMLERLSPLYGVDVICDPEVEPFWERFGMKRSMGMVLRTRPPAEAGS
jgi:ribosomal protein S18 acetylase RimI-like enzyme